MSTILPREHLEDQKHPPRDREMTSRPQSSNEWAEACVWRARLRGLGAFNFHNSSSRGPSWKTGWLFSARGVSPCLHWERGGSGYLFLPCVYCYMPLLYSRVSVESRAFQFGLASRPDTAGTEACQRRRNEWSSAGPIFIEPLIGTTDGPGQCAKQMAPNLPGADLRIFTRGARPCKGSLLSHGNFEDEVPVVFKISSFRASAQTKKLSARRCYVRFI